jgi:glycosyltransferase involved in cell wall biosynthesis
MIHYFLPSAGIYGGVKVGYQFAELLWEIGRPAVVASPAGEAAQWLACSVPVVDREAALARLGPADVAIFSLPHDHAALAETGARLVFHCQGTDPRIDPVLRDPRLRVLTCWAQASDYVRQGFGREPIEVGISVSDVFFSGAPAREDRVGFMPRRGHSLARRCRRRNRWLDFVAIEDSSEAEVARELARASVFLATARGEWFGLPALEAMASGCVVLSVPVRGGMEYLRPGENCVVSEPARLPEELGRLARPEAAGERARLRRAALVTAGRYRRSRQRERLRQLLTSLPELAA